MHIKWSIANLYAELSMWSPVKSSHSIPAHSENWGRSSKCYRTLGCTEKGVWRSETTGLRNNGAWSLEVTSEMNSLLQPSTVLKLICRAEIGSLFAAAIWVYKLPKVRFRFGAESSDQGTTDKYIPSEAWMHSSISFSSIRIYSTLLPQPHKFEFMECQT